jgi:hypothetical protein
MRIAENPYMKMPCGKIPLMKNARLTAGSDRETLAADFF